MPLIALDSNISIWCIKEECTPGQEAEMQAAIKLRKLLTKAGYDILIPIPVVSELLSNISDIAQRQEFFNEIRKTFQIGEFDSKAALLLAEILNYHYITSNKHYKNLGITKTALKYDALIIAAAKAHGAECLFASDPDCKKIAVHFLPVKNVYERPDSVNQNIGVFDELEMENVKQIEAPTMIDNADSKDEQSVGETAENNISEPVSDMVDEQVQNISERPSIEVNDAENKVEENEEKMD